MVEGVFLRFIPPPAPNHTPSPFRLVNYIICCISVFSCDGQDLAKMVGARGAAKLRKRLAKILASIKLTEGDSGGKRVVRGSGGAEADGGSGGWPSTGSAAKRQKLA